MKTCACSFCTRRWEVLSWHAHVHVLVSPLPPMLYASSRSGDIGLFTVDGNVKIVDRKKNIFKLSQGEYIAAEKIENAYLKSPFVEQVFLYGDSLQVPRRSVPALHRRMCTGHVCLRRRSPRILL